MAPSGVFGTSNRCARTWPLMCQRKREMAHLMVAQEKNSWPAPKCKSNTGFGEGCGGCEAPGAQGWSEFHPTALPSPVSSSSQQLWVGESLAENL